MKPFVMIACVAGLAASANAQSASVRVESSAPSAAPGATVTISVIADFDTGGAAGGVFGSAGLYGFGGDSALSGSAASGASSANQDVNDMLTFGETSSVTAGDVRAAGGRGFDGGLGGSSATLLTYDLTLAGDASGDVTVDYDGAVVLVQGDALVTYSTNPGANQQSLSVTPVTISVAAGQPCGDQNGDGQFNGADFNAWLANFAGGNSLADVNGDGVLNGADFNAWLSAFAAGNAGPLCS